jgi:hypothetical protein
MVAWDANVILEEGIGLISLLYMDLHLDVEAPLDFCSRAYSQVIVRVLSNPNYCIEARGLRAF